MKLQGIVCCAICLALPAFAQTSSKNANAQTNNDKPPIQSAAAQRSRWAVEALNYTQEARQALANHDQSTAKQEVNQALNLIDKIGSANMSNSSSSSQTPDRVVPIYAEFEQTSFLQPILTAQHKTSNPNSTNNSEMAKNSNNSNLPQSDRPEAVTAVDQGYTLIALQTSAARNDLQEAKTDLNNNNPNDADQKLAAVQESVALASSEQNRPLVRARENLGLADSAAQNKNYSEARATLQAAATALDRYSQNSSAKHASDAKNLSQEILTATRQSSNTSAVSQKQIDSWWKQVADWTQASS